MEFGVLGDLKVQESGVSYAPSAPKQRQLLALLLINANEFVSLDACVDELWDGVPPRTVVPTLQTYVLQLRKALAAAPGVDSLSSAHERLVTGRGGYVLRIPPESFDLVSFERWAREASTARSDNDDLRSARLFRRALGIWRGAALSDVRAGPLLRRRISNLNERRSSLSEQCFEVELRLGHHHELLSELSAAANQHPLNENLQAQHMLALYRSGRQVQALDVYRRLRKVLGDELGLEPSGRVSRLHEAILARDPELELR